MHAMRISGTPLPRRLGLRGYGALGDASLGWLSLFRNEWLLAGRSGQALVLALIVDDSPGTVIVSEDSAWIG